jgi:methylisocitrate lyase
MCAKLRTAAAARRDRDLVLIARTNARGTGGLDEALRRARRYQRAGADWILPEGLNDLEEFATFAREIEAPLVASLAEFGATPLLPYDELAELEYAAVLYPVTLLRVGMRAMEAALHVLLDEGSQESLLDLMQTDDDLNDLLDYRESEE